MISWVKHFNIPNQIEYTEYESQIFSLHIVLVPTYPSSPHTLLYCNQSVGFACQSYSGSIK
uniref:Uncharacterized protein n=1 Tax=Arundo donax TaxID=35708 RepID=A0A0A9FAA5_ARUDO